MKDYGVVVGEADPSNSAAAIDLEAMYAENSSWGDLVHGNTLQGLLLTSDNFEFVRKGDPKQGYDYGPTHTQWSGAGMACEADPGA